MNLRPQGFKLSKAISGFIQYKAAEALSPTTPRSYEHDLKFWLEHAGDVEVHQVSAQDIRAYLVWLRTGYKPRWLSGGDHALSPKTLCNIWASLAAFFTWASREFEIPNPMKSVPTPKFEEKQVGPFTKEDIEQATVGHIP
jgi:site-specific recombinase XerD